MLKILASATPQALLANDEKLPEMILADHPTWKAIFAGKFPKHRVKQLVLDLHPVVAGPGRYAFAAKVATISPADGKTLFMDIFNALKDPRANADKGWAAVAKGLGANDREIAQALASPSAEALDYLDVVRGHSTKSTAMEAVMIAWAVERHIPALWKRFADALTKHYGVPAAALAFLRFEAERGETVRKWIDHLVATYVYTAEPFAVYEGRRAAREAVWAWTVTVELA